MAFACNGKTDDISGLPYVSKDRKEMNEQPTWLSGKRQLGRRNHRAKKAEAGVYTYPKP